MYLLVEGLNTLCGAGAKWSHHPTRSRIEQALKGLGNSRGRTSAAMGCAIASYGLIAQLVVRPPCKRQVVGSSPTWASMGCDPLRSQVYSIPVRTWFRRNTLTVCVKLGLRCKNPILEKPYMWSVSLVVRIRGFHPGERSSILLPTTIWSIRIKVIIPVCHAGESGALPL